MNGIEVRSFNEAGIKAFQDYLKCIRDGQHGPNVIDLLDDASLLSNENKYRSVTVESRRFTSRREAADYFHNKFKNVSAESLRKDAGLWTWLSLFYFDQVCPDVDGRKTVRNDYTYIFMPDQSRYFYRHLLFVAWYAKHVSPVHNRLFLDTTLHQLDKFTQDVLKRLYLTRIDCIFEVLDRLYWDRDLNRPRRGVNSPRKVVAGDLVHRFPTRIRQLEKTYDLLSLTASQLIDLLGEEFASFDSQADHFKGDSIVS